LRPDRDHYPRPGCALDDDFDWEPVEVLERNGNLSLVERRDGSVDWLAPFELED
jgi:hypothetical protein